MLPAPNFLRQSAHALQVHSLFEETLIAKLYATGIPFTILHDEISVPGGYADATAKAIHETYQEMAAGTKPGAILKMTADFKAGTKWRKRNA